MDDSVIKRLRNVGEAGFVRIVTRYAKQLYPHLRPDQAFAKLYCDDSPEGLAIRRATQIGKPRPPRLAQEIGTPVMDEMGIPVRDAGGRDALDTIQRDSDGDAFETFEDEEREDEGLDELNGLAEKRAAKTGESFAKASFGSEDFREGAAHFVEKRAAAFSGR